MEKVKFTLRRMADELVRFSMNGLVTTADCERLGEIEDELKILGNMGRIDQVTYREYMDMVDEIYRQESLFEEQASLGNGWW